MKVHADSPETAYLPARPSRVKVGPLAAVIATAAILAGTAVPDLRTAPPAPVSDEVLLRATSLGGTLDLGAGLGRFEALGPGRFQEFEGGRGRVELDLVSVHDGDAGLRLSVDLGGRAPAGVDAPRLFVPAEGRVRPLLRAERTFADGTAYYAYGTGELQGVGRLAGHVFELRPNQGTAVRRGTVGETTALTGRFTALSTASPDGEAAFADGGCELVLTLRD